MELPDCQREEDEQAAGEKTEAKEKKIAGVEADGPSISLKTFCSYTNSLADKFKDVNMRLIAAFGLDTSHDGVRIEWDQFLSLKCFMELFTLKKPELEKVWLKALDPRGLTCVPIVDVTTFLERIARGSMDDEPTAISKVFSESMLKLFELENCVTENKKYIDMSQIKRKFQSKVLDVELFNQLVRPDCLFEVKSINHHVD